MSEAGPRLLALIEKEPEMNVVGEGEAGRGYDHPTRSKDNHPVIVWWP